MDTTLIVALTAAALAGALVGERFARHLSTTKLRRGFGLVAVGVTLVLAGGFGGHAA